MKAYELFQRLGDYCPDEDIPLIKQVNESVRDYLIDNVSGDDLEHASELIVVGSLFSALLYFIHHYGIPDDLKLIFKEL